jgi:hypothetical protein
MIARDGTVTNITRPRDCTFIEALYIAKGRRCRRSLIFSIDISMPALVARHQQSLMSTLLQQGCRRRRARHD